MPAIYLLFHPVHTRTGLNVNQLILNMVFNRPHTPPHHPSPFAMMQMAVEVVNSSPHPTNKIAAAISGIDHNGDAFATAATNFWPEPIKILPPDTRIGGGSGTIHAETACILRAPRTEGGSIYITDPFCPNCAKNIAEAGIKKIFIDHKGFEKDFAERRGNEFQAMSMEICKSAGISVYEVRRKDEVLTPILEMPDDFIPANENPVRITKYRRQPDTGFFTRIITEERAFYPGTSFAVTIAEDPKGKGIYVLSARDHMTLGYTRTDHPDIPQGSKYSFTIEPINRLLMNASRLGLRLIPGYMYNAVVPTPREFVNMIGAGHTQMIIGDITNSPNPNGMDALRMLTENDILTAVTWS